MKEGSASTTGVARLTEIVLDWLRWAVVAGAIIRGMVATPAAGFWLRALAAALDFGIFALVQASYGALAHLVWSTQVEDAWTLAPMVWAFTFVFAAAYTAVLHALFGQTVGKMIVGVRVVVGEDGVPPSFGASLLRYVAYFVSSAPLGLGYVMAALRDDKRALHDLIAGTRVERVRLARAADGPAGPGAETPVSQPCGSGAA